MRLLFVADPYSIHTVRWIRQLQDTGWDIHIFDPLNHLIHRQLQGVTVYTGWKKPAPEGVDLVCRWPFARGRHFLERNLPALWKRIVPEAAIWLAELIQDLQPDCIHSTSILSNSQYVLEARRLLGGALPAPWLYTSQGSDIYFWREFSEYHSYIRGVVSECDYYICECERDLNLARQWGFNGTFLGYFQGGGGYPIAEMQGLRQPGPSSTRRIVTVKGLQGGWGRAFVALDALEKCLPLLDDYEIYAYQVQDQVKEAIHLLSSRINKTIHIVDRVPPEEIWELFGRARLSLAVNYSDGIPNGMIEAMIMGAFPLQSNPGGATEEWIEDRVNGLLVSSEDSDNVADAIRRALADDQLVDRAASLNDALTRQRIDEQIVKPKVIGMYEQIVAEAHSKS